ncbi:MAG TPA: glycosyltransferase family 4 protein [bacterium]|nr:glycosyltransferase family 4 protein [bacterium]HPQ65380.1 glycosyltransferase family 4 protein [bacterium]
MKPCVLHIGPIPPEAGGDAAGGIATHLWDLAGQFRDRGWRVSVFAGTDRSFHREGIEIIGLPRRGPLGKLKRSVRILAGRHRTTFAPLGWEARLRAAYLADILRGAVAAARPDLIHLHSLSNTAGLSLAALRLPVPVAATNYELWFPPGCSREPEVAARIAENTGGVIHISEYTRDRAIGLGVRCPEISRIIHIPVRKDRIPLLNRERMRGELGLEGKPAVFFYGTFQPVRKKGLDILIRAFVGNRTLRTGCRLVLRTGEDGAGYARERLRRSEIEVKIVEQVTREELAGYYTAADVFVMPSRSEGYGIAYVEALMAGTPSIGFHRTLGEIRKRMGTEVGALFDAENESAEDLGRKIESVLAASFDRQRLRETALMKLSWDNRFSDFENFYREVLDHGS